ncbi:uncharacterized protein LOC136078887 [Hydra vulgaris]|uniref:Uncharacterized protein LOC136078887 n=1 Tax=Hydra vulgaris TaxID=6087 RepID=A0ABM4BNV2_HYDVU
MYICPCGDLSDIVTLCSICCCTNPAIYGLTVKGPWLTCPTHKEVDHVLIRRKKCSAKDCKNYPWFKSPSGIISCTKHREKDCIISIKSKRCIKCYKKFASFCEPGTKSILYCKDCKPENSRAYQACEVDTCKKYASYGLFGGKKERCVDHRNDDDLYLRIK